MLEIGSLVDGKYRILRVVGKGGMSVVYQAVNEKANKMWAVKEVRKDGVQNFEVVKQNLVVETEMLKRFSHPYLPSIIDVIDEEDSFLIVMDYIEGNSLSNALEQEGAQNQDDVIEWAKQLCDVLGYLHSRNPAIIYRDMKPANVMLRPDGNVCLIDFGTAREFKSSSVEDTTCLGTQGYAAPEQYGGHGQTDARTDIYCLGTTMYHLVTGHNPSKPPYEMYPIRQWNPMLSSGLEEIITKCTQRNPEDRYQNCAELMYALEHYQDLDIENKKAQNKKWKTFLLTAILSVVTLVVALGFKVGASVTATGTYQEYLNVANDSSDENIKIENFKKAISYNPSKSDAYVQFLNSIMDDSNIDETEYKAISQTFTTDNLNKLKASDKEAYAKDVCMELADDLLFCYKADNPNDNDRKTAAANWYGKVIESGSDDSDLIKRATLRYSFTSSKSGSVQKGEVSDIDYKEYWDTLKSMAEETSLLSSSNHLFTLRCYKFITSELNTNNTYFAPKVSKLEFSNLLDEIESNLKKVTSAGDYADYRIKLPVCDKEVKSITNNIQLVRETLDSLYGNAKE